MNTYVVCNVVNIFRSNAVKGCAEPVQLWRRQYQVSTNLVRVPGRPGVSVLACGEGYSREDVRNCIAPMKPMVCIRLIKNPMGGSYYAHRSAEVRASISESETAPEGMQPVGQEHSRGETFVMKIDTKVPDFCERFASSSELSELPERCPLGNPVLSGVIGAFLPLNRWAILTDSLKYFETDNRFAFSDAVNNGKILF